MYLHSQGWSSCPVLKKVLPVSGFPPHEPIGFMYGEMRYGLGLRLIVVYRSRACILRGD